MITRGIPFVKTRMVPFGNSHGIRIPKALLDETGLSGEVEITAEAERLIIRPLRKRREGWGDAFKKMADRGDDVVLDPDSPSLTAFDEDEWE